MTDGDCLTTTSVRVDVDRDVKEELRDRRTGVRVLEWWKLLKLSGEPVLSEVVGSGIVCSDGVHLSQGMNKIAASYLCHRMMESQDDSWSDTDSTVSSK
jgi:hypothetical protein